MKEIKNNVRPGNRGTRFLGVLLCILLAAGLGAAIVCCYPTLWKEEKKVLENDAENEERKLQEQAVAAVTYAEQTSAMAAGIYADWMVQQGENVDPWKLFGGERFAEEHGASSAILAIPTPMPTDMTMPVPTELPTPTKLLTEDTSSDDSDDATDYYLHKNAENSLVESVPIEYATEEFTEYYAEYRNLCQQEKEAIRDWYYATYPRFREWMNLEYSIRGNGEEEVYSSENYDPALLDAAPFMLVVKYDENGRATVLEERGVSGVQSYYADAYGIEGEAITWTQEMSAYTSEGAILTWTEEKVLMVPKLLTEYDYGTGSVQRVNTDQIRNVTITMFCLDDTYQEYYRYTYGGYNSDYWRLRDTVLADYLILEMMALAVLVVLVLILSFVRPFALPSSRLARIPLEILLTVIGCYLAIMNVEGIDMIISTQEFVESTETMNEWQGMLKNLMTRERENGFLYFLNWAAWSGMFLCCIPGVLSIRQLFAVGLRRYLKEYTIIGRFSCFIWRSFKKLVASVKEIDFEEESNAKIAKAVLINFVIVTLLCCIWFVGIAGVILYSVLLLVFLCTQYKKIRQQYQNVHDMAARMAEGKLDAVYTGDCGVFVGLSEELCRVQQGFKTAVAEEVKSQRMKTELITNVSHDLKTPLTAIITYVDLLKNPELPVEEREGYIEILAQKSGRLKVLIEDLFEVSKANSGTISLRPVELDLIALLQEVQVELEDKIMQSGIEFRTTLPQDAEGKPIRVMLWLDGEKTSRIFENLFINVVKYGMPGSRAYVDVAEEEMGVSVTLKNMSRTELNFDTTEITERFVRGDASRNTEGSGLGLAIAKSFTEAQGGSLEIQTDGDLFKVTVRFVKPERTVKEPEVLPETLENNEQA